MAGAELSTESRLMALFAVLFATFAAGSCSGQVPLVMWSDGGDTFPPLASPLAGHIMSGSQWLSYLHSAVGPGPHNVLLFLQEKLSKDDFTMYGGVFGNKQDSAFLNLEALLEAAPSQLVLPAVSWEGSSATPALLEDRLGVSAVLIDPDTPTRLQLNPSESNLLIVSLPYCTGFSSSAACKQVLQSNDEVIGKVVSSMKAQDVSYTAIYTGLRPSRMIEQVLVSGRSKGRALLQTMEEPVKPPLMFNNTDGNTCIMLWAQNLTVSFGGAGWVDLALSAPTMDGSLCNGTISKLVLNYRNVSLYGDLSLTFSMSQRRYPVSARNWFTLDAVDVTHPNGSASFNGSRGIYAPAEYSFNCQSVSSLRNGLLVAALSTPAQWRLNFTDFQIQGFGILNGTSDFSYASDCAGFFTPGIWMGLITSLLMLLILTYGLHMIMQLRTMDRFDDPKGPSISVPQSE